MKSAELIKQLEQAGWQRCGGKGSHQVYRHPSQPGHISVPHPRKDLGVGLVAKLLRQAGLK
ncbi:type II toxin-antitoxin system HicA family toxin [Castellaniella sp. S9]|uniref:type II toxin-antitoxin system HicA family toxin n=1 Tax=Castellaniella sp. S9 TaxID=2993652 RepID=UPI0022B3357D|nr:type II toxin-antitoxin system HicA family toxin [Castellaniella sp. S9]